MNMALRTPPLRWLVIGLGIFVSLCSFSCQSLRQRDPLLRIPHGAATGYNILLITLDTTRADRLGCYGYSQAQTPVLDSIAARGFRFTDAIATALDQYRRNPRARF